MNKTAQAEFLERAHHPPRAIPGKLEFDIDRASELSCFSRAKNKKHIGKLWRWARKKAGCSIFEREEEKKEEGQDLLVALSVVGFSGRETRGKRYTERESKGKKLAIRRLEGRIAIVRCHSRASDRLYAWKMGLVFIGIAWCTSCGRYALMFNADPYWNCSCTSYTKPGSPIHVLARPRPRARHS